MYPHQVILPPVTGAGQWLRDICIKENSGPPRSSFGFRGGQLQPFMVEITLVDNASEAEAHPRLQAFCCSVLSY